MASLSQPGPAKAMLGQASFLAWAGPGQLWQGQAGLGQVRPAQASLSRPKQDIFLHGAIETIVYVLPTRSHFQAVGKLVDISIL